MAGGKESPRQKMIGMMYLVLTALLAMNVSKDILNAFVVVNNGLQKTNENFATKNQKTYSDFDAALAKDPNKTKAYHTKAQDVKKMCGELITYIDQIKRKVIMETDKKDEKAADTLMKAMQYIDSKDNYDVPTHIMIGDDPANPKDGEHTAKELKTKINSLRTALVNIFDNKDLFLPADKSEMDLKLGLQTPEIQVSNDGTKESWENGNFYHLPLAAVVTNLSKIQADIKNAEADVINKLLAAVKGKDFTFDKLVAKVIAPSSYIMQGEEYKADVLLVAFNSTTQPKVIIGEVDTTIREEGKNPLKGPGDSTKVDVSGGMGHYAVQAGAEGLQKWGGVIKVEKPGGGWNFYPFQSEYMVAKPAAAVFLEKMNVFYIGVDNPVTITAAGVAPENLSISMSGGTFSGSRGKGVVRVSSGTEATINVGAKFGNTNKSMGAFKFRVKRVPDPVAYVAGKKGDDIITKGELLSVQGVLAKLENFDFDLKFDVISFDMSMNLKGSFVTESSQSNRLSNNMASLLKNAGTGTKVYFENIRAKGPDGTVRKIPGVNLKVK
jgi:gliding motility-associated protein GldM